MEWLRLEEVGEVQYVLFRNIEIDPVVNGYIVTVNLDKFGGRKVFIAKNLIEVARIIKQKVEDKNESKR